MKVNRLIATAFIPVATVVTAWIGGYDFDTRGAAPAAAFLVCVFYTAWVWFSPWWDE